MDTNPRVIKLHGDVSQVLQDDYIQEVSDLAEHRYTWRKASNWTEAGSKILIGSGIVLSYCEGYFRTGYLAIIAGGVGTAGIVMREFSLYAQNESKQREISLRVALTEGYRFVRQFITDPLELKPPSDEEKQQINQDVDNLKSVTIDLSKMTNNVGTEIKNPSTGSQMKNAIENQQPNVHIDMSETH